MKLLRYFLFIILCVISQRNVFSQSLTKKELIANIQTVIDSSGAKVGVGIMGLDFSDTLFFNKKSFYPMMSVYKFPLAIAILNKVDLNELSLNQIIHISEKEMDTATWSPMCKDYPKGDIDISLRKLIVYSISQSDNNACDILFRVAGGTKAVEKFIHGLGIKDIIISKTEKQMTKGVAVARINTSTTSAMLELLKIVKEGMVLSQTSNDFLMQTMEGTVSGPNRLKGLLPAGTVVAHKTGTYSSNDITLATNDVGIITLPDGRRFAIVVYVTDFIGAHTKGELVIARISKLTFDYYSKN